MYVISWITISAKYNYGFQSSVTFVMSGQQFVTDVSGLVCRMLSYQYVENPWIATTTKRWDVISQKIEGLNYAYLDCQHSTLEGSKINLKLLIPSRFAIYNIASINNRLLQQSNTNHNIPLLAQYNNVSPTATAISSWWFRVSLTCDSMPIEKEALSRDKRYGAIKPAHVMPDINHKTCIQCRTTSMSIMCHHSHVPVSHEYKHRNILPRRAFTPYYGFSRSKDSQSPDREKRCGGRK
jgi:hypothetical protein